LAKDIGIDLGTANVLINVKGKGIVLNEPSVVAIDAQSGKVLAVGTEAYQMVGRTPGNIRAIRPLKEGVIADFNITEAMLAYFINKLNVKGFMSKPVIMICAPTNTTDIERKAIIEAAEKTGGGKVYLELEPKVAAVGAGMDIFKPQGNMVVDIGGGTSDIAVLSMGDVVTSRSLRRAGDRLDQDIVNHIKKQHNLLIGEHTAETLKKEIGYAFEPPADKSIEVRGRDLMTGLPREVSVNAQEITEAITTTLNEVIAATKEVLNQTPPELSADIIDRGVMLTGGGALLKNIDHLFADALDLPVVVADDPLDSVALGTGILLDHVTGKKKR
jgi:rod shape-determining protein MreB